jgi:hypothetical protein
MEMFATRNDERGLDEQVRVLTEAVKVLLDIVETSDHVVGPGTQAHNHRQAIARVRSVIEQP